MSEFSHAYADGKAEGYQQGITDVLEAARARLRAHPECSGQALVDWLSEEVKERKPDGKPVF
jgi:hypothetical protein